MQLPHCPKCDSTYTYEDSGMYICPECAHEWNPAEVTKESDILIVKDANGNLLADGDSVTVVKDLKVKGSSFDAENRHQSEKYPSCRRRSQY